MRYIYSYINKVTGERYIGQTCDIVRRSYEHKASYGGCRRFHEAIKQYGYDNFDFEILFEGDDELIDFNEKEKYFISLYNTTQDGFGYNSPHNAARHNFNKEVRENISRSLTGRKLSDDTKKKISDTRMRKKVSVDGVIFNSIKDAAACYGFDKRCLAYCLKHNKHRKYKGHEIEYV